MIIESDIAKASRYSNDALEAFYVAVGNGQARMALEIMVDIIETFAEKIDKLEEHCGLNKTDDNSAKLTPIETAVVETKVEELKEVQNKPQAKVKVQEKESE